MIDKGVNVTLCVTCAVGSLDRNVAKVNDMLQEMRVIAVDKEGSQSKNILDVHIIILHV